MKTGDTVRVYPHGSPKKAARAKVMLFSENGRHIALSFGETTPPFVIVKGGSAAVSPEHGLMMLAEREPLGNALHGEPWGPWIEYFGGGHYEIEDYVRENESEKEE